MQDWEKLLKVVNQMRKMRKTLGKGFLLFCYRDRVGHCNRVDEGEKEVRVEHMEAI